LETIDELTAFLATATVDGILGRLLYRGAAWSLMRQKGVLPPNAPPLGATIETDLAEHGFALLRGAMALRAQAGASDLTSKAFERAATAFEALVRNGDPDVLPPFQRNFNEYELRETLQNSVEVEGRQSAPHLAP
jgi:hypothetical protein